MHRVLLPFEYFEPTTVKEVVGMVDGQKARILAGGVDLVLKMRRRQILPEKVVSLQKVPGLKYVEGNGAGLKFGAMATLSQIEQSRAVREKWPMLSEAIGRIVSVQTKAMGTAVGNLCVGTPASDVAPALYAMGARVRITGAGGEREISIEKFFLDVGRTALGPHEIVTAILVPNPPAGSAGVFMKLSKTAEDIAKVNAAVMVTLSGGQCVDARIALGSVAPTPIRALKAEEALQGQIINEKTIAEASAAAAEAASPISDVRSTARYRKDMVGVLVKDALEKAAARAQG
ncbi:MAG: xanthine dehydrogenase family protein subunit M [Pseudomonadota bacterium]